MKIPKPPLFLQRQGFSLIATLSLMILLTLVTVGLLTLSTTVIRSSSSSQAEFEARANARMALNLAIARLQEQLGPDQRINVSADLMDDEAAAGVEKWVGVWDSDRVTGEEPEFRGWLVSGSEEQIDNINFSQEAANLDDSVTLLEGANQTLWSAPRVSLEEGGYAFAVVDENTKAKIAVDYEFPSEELDSYLLHAQSSPADVSVIPELEQIAKDSPRNEDLVSDATVRLLLDQRTREQHPSFSVWADGLLTDVRNGGFRKDLSLRLDDDSRSDHGEALYASSEGRNGITFQELKNFHDLPSRLTYNAGSFPHPDGDGLNPEIPILVGLADKFEAAEDPFAPYLRPLQIRASWSISFVATPKEGDESRATVGMVMEPIITLWNPHDVNIVMPAPAHLSVRCWGLPYEITLGNRPPIHFLDLVRSSSAQVNQIAMNIGTGDPLTMRPGEVLIYSRGQIATAPTNAEDSFDAGLGWTPDGGYLFESDEWEFGVTESIAATMRPSVDRGANGNAVLQFGNFVGVSDVSGNQRRWSGGLSVDRTGNEGEIQASQFPNEYFETARTRPMTVRDLIGSPVTLALFSIMAGVETGEGSQDTHGSQETRYLARLSPAARGYDFQATDDNTLGGVPLVTQLKTVSSTSQLGFSFDEGKGSFGGSYESLDGQSYIVTHSIPREPPLTLGAFQHAHANGVERTWHTNSAAFHDRILQPSVNHAIGNSFAVPFLDANETEGLFNTFTAVDHSWLVNDALWDDYFVSSLSERNAPHHTGDRTGTSADLFTNFVGLNGSEEALLPNESYRYAGTNPEADRDRLFPNGEIDPDAYREVASMLRVEGAFNVNSTDPRAWQAFLSSTRRLQVPVENESGGEIEWEEANIPITNLLLPKGSAASTSDLSSPASDTQWKGYRDVTDDEIEQFAEEMVNEVRARGPFFSRADFVNRRLDEGDEFAAKGALQAALDRSLNEELETGDRAISAGAAEMKGVAFPEADEGSRMTHVPGHVKQGDILTAVGSRMTVRSDTFKILAYGESRSQSGEILATARCEAVVTRSADWVDQGANEDVNLNADQITSPANQRFGRRFELIAFSWVRSPLE